MDGLEDWRSGRNGIMHKLENEEASV